MSKKQSDHTLSDLLSLKMTWFKDKNPDREQQIEYIKTMVRSNAFKGSFKLSKVFDEYQIPEQISDINKTYFTFYESHQEIVQEESAKIEALAPTELTEFCVTDTQSYERMIQDKDSSIQGNISDIDQITNEINVRYRRLADRTRSIARYTAERDAYTKIVEENKGSANTVLRQYIEEGFGYGFSPFYINESDIFFISDDDIVCGYYSNNTRIERNFGKAIIKMERVLDSLSMKECMFTYKFTSTSGTRHPHVSSGGNICTGDASHVIMNNEVPLSKRFNAMYGLLTTYNPSNPYESLGNFKDNTRTYNLMFSPNLLLKIGGKDLVNRVKLQDMPNTIRNGKAGTLKGIWKEYDEAYDYYSSNRVVYNNDNYVFNIETKEELAVYINALSFCNFGFRTDMADSEAFEFLAHIAHSHKIEAYNYSSAVSYTAKPTWLFTFRNDNRGKVMRGNYEHFSLPQLTNRDTYDAFIDDVWSKLQAKNQEEIQTASEEIAIPF